MKLSTWMSAKAIVEFVFGLGFVLMPGVMCGLFGLEVTPAAALMAQLFGTAFIFGSIVLWQARYLPVGEPAMRAIILAVVISNALGFLVTIFGTLSGVFNLLGWLPVALYLVFGIVFATYEFGKRTT